MNWMIEDSPDAPWNEREYSYPSYECTACKEILEEGEALDPCIIDGRVLCDRCSSDLIQLRFDGILSVAENTKKLLIQSVIPIN